MNDNIKQKAEFAKIFRSRVKNEKHKRGDKSLSNSRQSISNQGRPSQ